MLRATYSSPGMYRVAWAAVQRGLTEALLGYAVALWKRSRPRLRPLRLLPPPSAAGEDDDDAFCGLHHQDCPCLEHLHTPVIKVTRPPTNTFFCVTRIFLYIMSL